MMQMTAEAKKREYSYITKQNVDHEGIKALEVISADVPEPLFITDDPSGKVVLVNPAALDRLFGLDPAGLNIADVLDSEALTENRKNIYFSNRWYTIEKNHFQLFGKGYQKILLREKAGLPGPESLKAMQNMISVLLHRFRSPLTGMMGFVDILNLDARDSRSEKHLSNLENGIDYLYEMLDELEYFLQLDSLSLTSHFDASEMVNEILSSYSEEQRARISVINTDGNSLFSCRVKVHKILSLLIDNAIRHSEKESEITISIKSPSSVNVTNHGYAISADEKEWIFQPFTTSAADRMGNGLAIAQILSASVGASIDLVTGDDFSTFSLMLPPNKKSSVVN